MFKRKQTQFEITEHPDVVKALNAMWESAYEAGRRDALAIANDLYDEARATWATDDPGDYHRGIADVIERLES